mgnify:FL=1
MSPMCARHLSNNSWDSGNELLDQFVASWMAKGNNKGDCAGRGIRARCQIYRNQDQAFEMQVDGAGAA